MAPNGTEATSDGPLGNQDLLEFATYKPHCQCFLKHRQGLREASQIVQVPPAVVEHCRYECEGFWILRPACELQTALIPFYSLRPSRKRNRHHVCRVDSQTLLLR